MSWSRTFLDAIPLPDGGELITLRDAGEYIAALPKAMQAEACWLTATSTLLLVAEKGGDCLLPRIAMMRALYGEPQRPVPRKRAAKTYRLIS